MEAIFSWVGAALGALFVVAVAVAWWEHVVRHSRPPAAPQPVAPRAVSVDVSLDALAELPAAEPATGDAATRRATLDHAMDRMARPAAADPGAWVETSPMVLHPPAEGPAPVSAPTPEPKPATTRA